MGDTRLALVRQPEPMFLPPEGEADGETDALLERWARYVRLRRPPPGRCASAEGSYRIDERSWRFPHLTASPQIIEADRRLMHSVDRAVRGCPLLERSILVAHYVYRADPRSTCRKLALHKSLYGPRLKTARSMVRNLMRAAEARDP